MGNDTVEFRVLPTSLEYGSATEFFVNGQNFIELVRRAELPSAEAEGHPQITRTYAGLPCRVYSPPSRHFWGEAESGRRDGRVELLTYRDCGELGCWLESPWSHPGSSGLTSSSRTATAKGPRRPGATKASARSVSTEPSTKQHCEP